MVDSVVVDFVDVLVEVFGAGVASMSVAFLVSALLVSLLYPGVRGGGFFCLSLILSRKSKGVRCCIIC